MNTTLAITVGAVYTAALLFAAHSVLKARAELAVERNKRAEVEKTLARTELRVTAFAAKMAPLIAKTDWMTGRWGGQFDTLVRLENQRNADVDTARKALYEIPMINRNPINPTVYTTKDTNK
ncbi:hypothetical protein [Streptomyces sp. NPDC058252]|uniref:hypothetical protein n=1 Tax=Streptomyces sp. NPDC058252 TaxID=3346405 RepID=UPI0036EA2C77